MWSALRPESAGKENREGEIDRFFLDGTKDEELGTEM